MRHPGKRKDKGETPRYYGYSMPLQAFIVNTELLKPEDYPRKWLISLTTNMKEK